MSRKSVIIGIIVGILLIIGSVALVILNPFGERNKNIEFTVRTNGGVPFKWEYEIEDENIVKFVKTYEREESKNTLVEGGPVYINYVFKGNKKGTTKVKLRYVNITDGSVAKEEVHTLKVDSKHNVTLVVEPK